MYTLRYGQVELSDIEWKYLPAGQGPDLSGYVVKHAGPNPHLLSFLEEGQQWWSRLASSIRDEGIRNPPLLINLREGLYIRYGASRIYVAKREGVSSTPCIIADWTGRYDSFERLETVQDVLSKYKDKPMTVKLDPDIQILHCPHSHLPGSPNPTWLIARKNEYRSKKRLGQSEVHELRKSEDGDFRERPDIAGVPGTAD